MDYSWAISKPKWWCCESAVLNIPANLENSAVATALEKVGFHSNPKERQSQSMFSYYTTVLISHTSKLMLKILQTRLQQYVNRELPDVHRFSKGRFKLDLEKAVEREIKLPTYPGSSKKQESSRKTSTSVLLTMPKPLCGSQQTVENSERDGNTRPPDMPPEKSVCKSRSNS